MSFSTKDERVLPHKLCYELWVKRRYSLYHIPKVLREDYGIYNKSKNQNVTPQGVERAVWRYALDHLETARTDTMSIMEADDKPWDENAWNAEVGRKAKRFLSPQGLRDFIVKYPHLASHVK